MTSPITLVSDLNPRETFACDGIRRSFFVDWPARSSDDLYIVYEDESEPDINYTLVGINDDAGFSIQFDDAPPDGRTLVVERRGRLERTSNYGQQRQFNAASVNANDADTVLRLQEFRRDLRRAAIRATGDTATGQLRLPVPSSGQYLRWDADGNLINSNVDVPDVTMPDSHVVTKYPADVPLDPDPTVDNSARLNTFLAEQSALGGCEFVSDGTAYYFEKRVIVPSFVTVRGLKARLGPVATLTVGGSKKVAFSGIRLLEAASSGTNTLQLDTASVGGGPVSDYAKVGMPVTISDGIAGESNSITAIDDGTREITVANNLLNNYSLDGTRVTLEVAARLASNNTIRSDQVVVEASDVALLSVGDWVHLEDDRRTGDTTTWIEMRQVIGVETAGSNIISLSGQTRRSYLTSSRARLTVISPARRGALIGCSVECVGTAEAARFDPIYEIRFAIDCVLDSCEYPGTDTVGRRGNMFRIHKSYNCHALDCSGRNPLYVEEGEGNVAVIAYSTLCSFVRLYAQGARHGGQFVTATECDFVDCSSVDTLLTGFEGHGLNSVGCSIQARQISFTARTASSSNIALVMGNTTWQDGDHECLIHDTRIDPFKGNSGVSMVRVFTPCTSITLKNVHGENCRKFIIHRDTSGAGTLVVSGLNLIDCSVRGCEDNPIDFQGKASGGSVNSLVSVRIAGFRGEDLTRGILAQDVEGMVVEDSSLEYSTPDTTSVRAAMLLKRINGLRVVNFKGYASNRGLDIEDCPGALFLNSHLLDLGDTQWLRDRGGCDGTVFRGCNADTASGDAVTSDVSGGSTIVYKAVSNIGTETTTAYEFSASDKLLARVSSGAGEGEEVDFTDIAQSISAAASAIAVADLIHTASSDIASATTTDLSTATGMSVTITGTTTIEGFGTVGAGRWRILTFGGSLTLTHDGTALDLPGGSNIQTAAGDVAFMLSKGSGNWKCAAYIRDAGSLATQLANAVAITGGSITGITDLAIADGGTGASTAVAAHDNLSTKGSDVASATTTNLASATGFFVDITGTTTITGLGTVAAGAVRLLRFNGALTFTHDGTSLILPGAENITTASGDFALVVSLGSGNWACAHYFKTGSAGTLATTGESRNLDASLNAQTGTSYTLDVAGAGSDKGKVVRLTNAAGITVTLPATAAVGFYCTWGQGGAGQVTFAAAGSGTLVHRQSHTKSAGQHAQGGLIVYENSGGSAAQWTLTGDTAA